MDDKHLSALLKVAGAEKDGADSVVPGERTITLHAGAGGVPLNISKVKKVRVEGALLICENAGGETFVLALADVFAGAVDGDKKAARKAGFV